MWYIELEMLMKFQWNFLRIEQLRKRSHPVLHLQTYYINLSDCYSAYIRSSAFATTIDYITIIESITCSYHISVIVIIAIHTCRAVTISPSAGTLASIRSYTSTMSSTITDSTAIRYIQSVSFYGNTLRVSQLAPNHPTLHWHRFWALHVPCPEQSFTPAQEAKNSI